MHSHTAYSIGEQIFWLIILAMVVASVSRTVVFEELFRETRDWCKRRSEAAPNTLTRKFFYLLTCDYCFSHYVALFVVIITQFRMLIDDGRGYVISFFALVFVANALLNVYGRLRLDMQREKVEIKTIEKNEDVKA